MQFGIHIFPTEHSIQPDDLARAVEERGLKSLWFSEHTHIPVRFLTMPGRGPTLPDYYWQTYDIFVAMTLAAAVTQNIKIGSGVSLVIERDPIHLAKETATLDLISKGRLIFGVGAGWLEIRIGGSRRGLPDAVSVVERTTSGGQRDLGNGRIGVPRQIRQLR